MPNLYRDIPPELKISLQNAQSIRDLAWSVTLENGLPISQRMHTFSGFLTILFEHHDSTILLLATGNNDASAFSLARPILETFYRGLWMYLCASDDEVEKIRSDSFGYPKFIKMTNSVDAKLGGLEKFNINPGTWGMLCGFTHSGLEQLGRRYNDVGDLMPNYPINEVINVLSSGTRCLALMTYFACFVAGKREEGAQILSACETAFGEAQT